MRKVIKKNGYTIAELIVALAVVSIFVLSLTAVLSVGSKIYLKETARGNTQVALETLSDDVKGYVMYGEDIRVFYILDGSESTIAGVDVSSMAAGTEMYLERNAETMLVYGKFINPTSGEVTSTAAPVAAPEDFEGHGIDLGFKRLFLENTTDGIPYIKGLAYDISYYRGLNLDLDIKDLGMSDINKTGIYEISLSGEASTGHLHVKSSVAVTGLNKKK